MHNQLIIARHDSARTRSANNRRTNSKRLKGIKHYNAWCRLSGRIKIEGNSLVFEIHGMDMILAVRKTITVPLSHVVSVSTDNVSWGVFEQMKVAGAGIPGVVKDGTYLSRDGLVFFEMHHPEKCITVSLNHESYKKIIFEVEDKDNAAKMINDAMGKNQS